jgi:hypothetical protein
MRYMVLVKATKETEAGVLPGPEVFEKMWTFNEGLSKDGVLLALDGLRPSSKGTRLRFDGGRTTVTDGPFAETKELINGFWIVQCKSREEVIERFTRAPFDDGAVLEIREFHEAEDFGEVMAAAIRERSAQHEREGLAH